MTEEKNISLAAHEAKVAELNADVAKQRDAVTQTESRLSVSQAEVVTLRAQVTELTNAATSAKNDKTVADANASRFEAQVKQLTQENGELKTKRNELEIKVAEVTKATEDAEIRKIIAAAVEVFASGRGSNAPMMFDGHEGDPSAWVKARYATLAAFKTEVRNREVIGSKTTAVSTRAEKSGHDPAKAATEANAAISDEEQKRLDRMNLSVEYDGVTNEDEARKLFEASRTARK